MKLTQDQIDAYLADGYLKIPDVFTPAEMSILRADCYSIVSADRERSDGNISELNCDSTRVSFGIDLDSKAVAAAVRVPRILEPVRQMLGEQIYLFQTRINAKMKGLGEGYPWHTDFANWINDGVPRGSINDMITMSVLLTESSPENGALQVVPGSHQQGVGDLFFDSKSVGYQSYNAPEAYVKKVLSETVPVFIEGKPGDIVLFAPEIMHGSEENRSDLDRMYLMFIYNRSDNLPVEAEIKRKHMTPYINYAYEGDLTELTDDAIVG
jgi:ectoine hydroxylase